MQWPISESFIKGFPQELKIQAERELVKRQTGAAAIYL